MLTREGDSLVPRAPSAMDWASIAPSKTRLDVEGVEEGIIAGCGDRENFGEGT